jgi:hypothetical protein
VLNLFGKKSLKILAFFGSDIRERGIEFLQQMHLRGYILLALDVPAIGLASKAGVSYTVIDDWINSKTMRGVFQRALRCRCQWFRIAKREFTIDGVCWPEFDREAMFWFWFNVILAEAFAKTFRTHKGQELSFFQSSTRRPTLFYYPSDICAAFWQKELKGKTKVLKLLRQPFFSRFFYFSRKRVKESLNRGKKLKKPKMFPSVLQGKIVLAFNPGEFHRFTSAIEQLSIDFSERVVLVTLSNSQSEVDEIARQWSIPVLCGPATLPIDAKLPKFFLRGYKRSLKTARGKSWEKALKYLDFHFEHYCIKRWPKLVNDFRYWQNLFRRWRPKAVIVSSLFDAESQLPAEAARQLKIPTFSVPHAGVMSKEWTSASKYILYSFKTQEITYRQASISKDRLLPCTKLFAENEYPTFPLKLKFNKSRLKVLIITYGVIFKHCFIPNIGPRAQLRALKALSKPPLDIVNKIQLFIKVHPNPNYADLELFEAAGNSLEEKVVATNSNIHSVMSCCDIAILVNSTGSALINILKGGKPVIFFWTDYQSPRTDIFYDIFLSSGLVAHNAKELWHLIRKFLTHQELVKEMHYKAKKFYQKYLDDSNYPTISEVVKEVLSKKK